jgi:hypothetical protein
MPGAGSPPAGSGNRPASYQRLAIVDHDQGHHLPRFTHAILAAMTWCSNMRGVDIRRRPEAVEASGNNQPAATGGA